MLFHLVSSCSTKSLVVLRVRCGMLSRCSTGQIIPRSQKSSASSLSILTTRETSRIGTRIKELPGCTNHLPNPSYFGIYLRGQALPLTLVLLGRPCSSPITPSSSCYQPTLPVRMYHAHRHRTPHIGRLSTVERGLSPSLSPRTSHPQTRARPGFRIGFRTIDMKVKLYLTLSASSISLWIVFRESRAS